MIQAVAENKYSFNMQVSAEAMAALRKHLGATTFDECVQLIRYRPSARFFGKPSTETAHKVDKRPSFTNPFCVRRSLARASQRRRRSTAAPLLVRLSARVIATYSNRICVGQRFRREMRQATRSAQA
jgi:hypothetical protein